MAWWIHDHLPYASLYFFAKLGAFNIGWHEAPERRIDSYAPPKGCLTRPGMANHGGAHASEYPGFPQLVHKTLTHSASAAEGQSVSGSLAQVGIHPLPRSNNVVSNERIDDPRDKEGV